MLCYIIGIGYHTAVFMSAYMSSLIVVYITSLLHD